MFSIETKELKISDKFKSKKLELGIITLNLSNAKVSSGDLLY